MDDPGPCFCDRCGRPTPAADDRVTVAVRGADPRHDADRAMCWPCAAAVLRRAPDHAPPPVYDPPPAPVDWRWPFRAAGGPESYRSHT